ncbi:hypothetical protein B0O99DRAFT_385347 [Bisporella sp. PMI_857]|nr:hypothetical protein B0O99DRAFT_385347 [Bisporella sp. PMI_857]
MSTVATEPRHEIYEIAQLCLESFSVYLLQKRPRHEVIKEEQQRFWAWSNALKVFANDQICLDAQLRGTRYDEIRRLVVSLLRVLNQNLSLALKSGPATETSIYQMGTLGNENVNLNDVPTDSAFELALFGINGSLKRLEKFAAAILQATQGSLARRVSAFAQENHDEEVERYINFMITYRFQVFGRDGKSTSTLPPKMREILFDSSVYRHYRLKRLRTKTIPERRQLRRNVGTKPPSNMEDAVTISRVEHEDHPKKLSPQKLEKGAQSEYQTLPLTVNTRDFKKNLVETQSNPQQINKVSVSEMGMPEFPPPPRPLNGEECCTCPFCGENFAIGDLEGYKWK